MAYFKVFDKSILQHLEIDNWQSIPELDELLSSSVNFTTSDGHLVFMEELTGESAPNGSGARAYRVIGAAGGASEHWIPGALRDYSEDWYLASCVPVDFFYCGQFHRGDHFRFERFTYATEKVPEVFGNWEDQPPGYTVFTVVSNKRALDSLVDKWTSDIARVGPGAKSTLHVAENAGAIQARFFCDEVHIEDVIDFYVAAGLAIKERRNSRMLLGLSYTQMESSSKVETSPTGRLIHPDFPEVTPVRVVVEEKYGPFKQVWPSS